MKLAQKLALGYFNNKLRTIAIVSPRKAAEEAFKLFCTPYSKRRPQKSPPIFKQAEKVVFSIHEHTIHGFRWKPTKENGRKILICHGFDSYSYRFERYITPLLNVGFEVLAFDAPGHGLSSGSRITITVYRDMVLDINKRFGPIDGIMAHSLGGLGAGLALEKMEDHQHKRFVLISPATETTRAVSTFFKYIKASEKVKDEFEKLIIELGGYPSAWYSVARIMQQITTPTLWVHDKEDPITPFEDMKHMLEQNLSHIEFEITEGLGHSLYNDDKVANRIIDFFVGMLP
jgi:alpha-beta hydrolase superfamily lysophospholipase